jgi:hypothetical protein
VVEALVALSRPRRDGTGRWTGYASALGDPYLEFVAAETVASAIITYAPAQVPELLQVPAYAQADHRLHSTRARRMSISTRELIAMAVGLSVLVLAWTCRPPSSGGR